MSVKSIDYLDNVISNNLVAKQKDSKRLHDLNQSLSASILGQPLQSQILHIIGVPSNPVDEYTLRKFERGHHVEEWIMKQMPGMLNPTEIIAFAATKDSVAGADEEGQAFLQYRSAKGHIDGLIDMSKWTDKDLNGLGIIPHEIKSTKNSAFKYLIYSKEPKWSHKLQAGMYAVALGVDHFVIHYIAADDYRIMSFLCDTKDIKNEIEDIITEVEDQLLEGLIPEFSAREDWQMKDHDGNKDYENYPAWSSLTNEECMEKLEFEYPKQYKRLMSFKGGENK